MLWCVVVCARVDPGGSPPLRSDLLERACRLLADNTRTARFEGRQFVFSVPSARCYPFQWFWDSCFHAIVWARIDVERAADELRALFAMQAPSGLLPHVVFWDRSRVSRISWHYLESRGRLDWILPGRTPRTTSMIQPPVVAQAVEAVVDAGGDGFLAEALPVLERYYRYLARERDPDADALISIIAQFESGLDFSPAYDAPLGNGRRSAAAVFARARLPQLINKLVDYDLDRVFRLNRRETEDVLVNSIYADGLRTLGRLAARAGAAELCRWADAQARRVVERLLERCYDEVHGLFFNLEGLAERPAGRVKTVISLIPLLLADLPAGVAARLVEHLEHPREFGSRFPVPSVALDEPSFLPDSRLGGHRLIWRGPCSLNTNWLISLGLRRHGYDGLADTLADRSRALVEKGGFNEFFNPITGAPVGAERFGWATLASVL